MCYLRPPSLGWPSPGRLGAVKRIGSMVVECMAGQRYFGKKADFGAKVFKLKNE